MYTAYTVEPIAVQRAWDSAWFDSCTARRLCILFGDQDGRHASANMIGMPIQVRELANRYLEFVRARDQPII